MIVLWCRPQGHSTSRKTDAQLVSIRRLTNGILTNGILTNGILTNEILTYGRLTLGLKYGTKK